MRRRRARLWTLAGVAAAAVTAAAVVLALDSGESGDSNSSRNPGGGSAAALWVADFETGDLSQWEGVQEHTKGRASVVTSPHVQGKHAGRFEARKGEFTLNPDAPTRNRTEAILSIAKNRHNPSEGDDWWYRWWIYLPEDLRLPSGNDFSYIITTQWLGVDTQESNGTFEIRNDNLNRTGWPRTTGPVLQYTTGGAGRKDGYDILWTMPMSKIARNTWHKVLLRRRWSTSEVKGFSELWWDGVPQTFFEGSNAPASMKKTRGYHRTIRDTGGVYFKQGIYRSDAIGGTAVIYLDGLRIATTREAADT